MDNLTEMLKGILEGCVLEIISRERAYGYEITRQLNALGFEDVAEGTVYTILVRLEKNELVTFEKKPSQKGPPRKFYALSEKGRAQRDLFWDRWDFLSAKVNSLKEKENEKQDGSIL